MREATAQHFDSDRLKKEVTRVTSYHPRLPPEQSLQIFNRPRGGFFTPMQTLNIEYRPVDSLIPYANNARTHSEEQVAQIAASIREFGFTNPILVDGERGVIAGHGRLLSARKLGMDTVPVIELAHLTPIQKRAYILADNRLAENAGWDKELLALELADLNLSEFDLDLLGFTTDEIDELLNGD
jgi:ParB-like chromosome segregation protein Spo0J